MECAWECTCLWRDKEGVGCSGAGVKVGCKDPDVGVGMWACAKWKTNKII